MDAQSESLVQYLIGNFEKLPSDVLNLLIGQLKPQDALNLCSTNKRFYETCKRIKALEKQALQFTAYEAPLGEPIHGPEDYASLIRRGFKTFYTFDDAGKTFVPMDFVRFGLGYSTPFEIVGLPPPRGTRVWLFVEISDDNFQETIVQVYSTKEDLIRAWRSEQNLVMDRAHARASKMDWTHGRETISKEERLEELLNGEDMYGFRVFEVELP